MVPADDDHKDTPEVDSSTSTKEHKSGRLTTMPDYLMHWWTPVLFAIILLAAGCFLASIWRMPLRPVSWQTVNPFWPPSWPFNYHWPSKDAMALCATIAGAGFAFSAWQQRSHDNAVRDDDKLDRERAATQARAEREEQRGLEETRRLEQIERDEYWKRREQIYQLLGSKNPGLRLGAVALLAELADTAARSTLLNDTEKRQLQRHIIDTLCLQVRHEGQSNDNEGSCEEHAEIQRAIIEAIVDRIKIIETTTPKADWSQENINLTKCVIRTPVTIYGIKTYATLNIDDSKFTEPLTITNSSIGEINWGTSTFLKGIKVESSEHRTTIHIDTMPKLSDLCTFSNTTFVMSEPTISIKLSEIRDEDQGATHATFRSCEFQSDFCICPDHCKCKPNPTTYICTCWSTHECTCDTACINADVEIIDNRELENAIENPANFSFVNCRLATLKIFMTHAKTSIFIAGNRIDTALLLSFSSSKLKDSYEQFQPAFGCIDIVDNYFWANDQSKPIMIGFYTNKTIKPPIRVSGNYLINPSAANMLPPHTPTRSTANKPLTQPHYPLSCEVSEHEPELFHFEGPDPSHPAERPTFQWYTGRSKHSPTNL